MTNLQSIMELTQKDIDAIVELTTYNSMTTLTSIIKDLKMFKARIALGEKITYKGKLLTEKIFEEIIEENFSEYVVKSVFKEKNLKKKIYFNIDNTEPGIDLIYTENTPNKLFSWIADIDSQFCLMKLIPTGIIYIRDNDTKQIIPFVSEKGNYYVFNDETGKIIEIM